MRIFGKKEKKSKQILRTVKLESEKGPRLKDKVKALFKKSPEGKKENQLLGGRRRVPDSMAELKGKFGSAQDVRQEWDLTDKEEYLYQQKKHGLPRVVVPLAALLILVGLLFWLLPILLPKIFASNEAVLQENVEPDRIYSSSTRIITAYASNIYSIDDVTSVRISQVLYNEPVTLLDTNCNPLFVHIMTSDGISGYVKESEVTDNVDSVEPNLHTCKLVVSDMSKNIMSAASNGTLLVEVMMNTVLYADVKSDGVYQVSLPGGETGWISSSGVIELGVNESVEEVGVRYFVSSVMSFVNATQLSHGLTMRGMSIEGLAYVSADVNGIVLPRTMAEQAQSGEAVDIVYDEVTGLLDVSCIMPGDLVFFSNPADSSSNVPYQMGICTDTGSLIMVSKSQTSIKLITLEADSDIASQIISVRRIFQ